MDPKILNFLNNNRVSIFTTLLSDGSPHSAALHYSHIEEPLTLYFSTENTSRKCQDLLTGKTVKASVVVGFSEQEWITLQLNGHARLVSDSLELKSAKAIHYPKHPNSQKFENDPSTVFLAFTPTWYRYTEFKRDTMIKIEAIL